MDADVGRVCRCCYTILNRDAFAIKRNGELYKQCMACLAQKKTKYRCEHGASKYRCRDCGTGHCEHGNGKYCCAQCGTGRCEHGVAKFGCRVCTPALICPHERWKVKCRVCDAVSSYAGNVASRVWQAIRGRTKSWPKEVIGCGLDEFKEHIESLFSEGQSWDNYGSIWHIDHIKPIKWGNPSMEELIERLHYSNVQPLGRRENQSKGNRYSGKEAHNHHILHAKLKIQRAASPLPSI